MAFGATGPEALNADLNRWFSGVFHMRARRFRNCSSAFFIFVTWEPSDRLCTERPLPHVRKPLVLSRRKPKWAFFAQWSDWRMARNNDDVINTQGEAAWCGDGCNLVGEMAEYSRLISDWKARRKPGGRGMRRSHWKQTVRRGKGRVETTHPGE